MGRFVGVLAGEALLCSVVLVGSAIVSTPDADETPAPESASQQLPPAAAPPSPVTPFRAEAPPTTATPPPVGEHADEHADEQVDEQAAERAQEAAQEVVPSARVGVELLDRQSGAVVTSANENEQIECMSVVKLLIAVDMLRDAPGGIPDPNTADRIRRMLRNSDDSIANALWSTNGGGAIVTRMTALLGLTGTEPPDTSGEWGDAMTTPRDLVMVYRYITDRLPAPARDLILDALSHSPETAADGFDQHFGIPDGLTDLPWAIKQGWGTSGSRAIMNTTGLVGADSRYVVVLLVTASRGSYTALPRAVTAASESLRGNMEPPP